MTLREHLKEQLAADPEFARAWEAEEPAYQLRRAFIGARTRLGWTQAELAERMGTDQANVSRAETTGQVSAEFFDRFVQAVGGSAIVRVKLPGARPLSLQVGDLTKGSSRTGARGRKRAVPVPAKS